MKRKTLFTGSLHQIRNLDKSRKGMWRIVRYNSMPAYAQYFEAAYFNTREAAEAAKEILPESKFPWHDPQEIVDGEEIWP
jgi:hypothetical protein